MPGPAEHIAKANLEYDFIVSCGNPLRFPYPDQLAVAVFYCALHIAKSYFSWHGIHHDRHGEVSTAIRRDNKLRAAAKPYQRLYENGRSARYNPNSSGYGVSAKIVHDEMLPDLLAVHEVFKQAIGNTVLNALS